MLEDMALDPRDLPADVHLFLEEYHIASLTTLRPDGSPHVVPVGFTFDGDEQLVRIITFAGSRKVANVAATPGGRAVVCQVDGPRWLSLEGTAVVSDDPERVAESVARYSARYRPVEEKEGRVTIEISIDRVIGRA